MEEASFSLSRLYRLSFHLPSCSIPLMEGDNMWKLPWMYLFLVPVLQCLISPCGCAADVCVLIIVKCFLSMPCWIFSPPFQTVTSHNNSALGHSFLSSYWWWYLVVLLCTIPSLSHPYHPLVTIIGICLG